MRAHRPASTTSKPSPTNLALPASTIGTPPAATHSRDSDVTPPPQRPTGGPANSPRHPPRSPTSRHAPRSTPRPAERLRLGVARACAGISETALAVVGELPLVAAVVQCHLDDAVRGGVQHLAGWPFRTRRRSEEH